jgi:hypothetical protein
VAINFEWQSVHHYEETPIPGSHNAAEYVAAVNALATANNGQFSCLNSLMGMLDNTWWSQNNNLSTSFAWSSWLLYALHGSYGYVNDEAWWKIQEGLHDGWFPPESNALWSQVNHEDPSKSRVRCDVMAGGDWDRGIYGQTQADHGNLYVHTLNHMCLTGTVYLQATASGMCTAVDAVTDVVGKVCGAATLLYSEITPLSLLWDPELSVEEFGKSVSLVQFPLDVTAAPGTSYEWKASNKTPLLVYDPEHKGEITSASQLFGAWTFGGKSDGAAKTAWRDAYEALGTLDTDKDGIVRDAELAPLALWFDADRDAISQPGEVVSAAEAGLTQLRYKDPVTREGSNDKFLALGFVRKTTDSEEVRGASVDWMARAAEFAQNLVEGDRMLETTQRAARIDADSPNSSATRRLIEFGKERNSKFSGKWLWIKNLNQADSASGFFALSSDEQGRLLGTSIAEWKAVAASGERRVLNFVTMTGKIDPTDSSKITFNLVLPDEHERAISSATLVEQDGHTYLQGETNIQTTLENGSMKSVVYRWWARKE